MLHDSPAQSVDLFHPFNYVHEIRHLQSTQLHKTSGNWKRKEQETRLLCSRTLRFQLPWVVSAAEDWLEIKREVCRVYFEYKRAKLLCIINISQRHFGFLSVGPAKCGKFSLLGPSVFWGRGGGGHFRTSSSQLQMSF